MVATVSDGQVIEIVILMCSQSVFVLWHSLFDECRGDLIQRLKV